MPSDQFVFCGNMRIGLKPFNIYLLVVLLGALCGGGCETLSTELSTKKETSTLRVHLEVTPDGTDRNAPVPIYRASPVYVNVEKEPFLNEGRIEKASVVDVMGGFSIFIQFDRRGTWLLEQYTTAHKGRRVAIMSQFGDIRWLAAPVMNKRITDGVLVFTPDATREESERIVRGLNNVVKGVRGREIAPEF